MIKFIILFVLVLMPLQPSTAQTKSHKQEITLCHEGVDLFPWFKANGDGLTDFQVKLIEEKINIKFNIILMPWKRCLLKVKEGEIHAALSSTYTKERASWFEYPLNLNGEVQREFRLNSDRYMVYVNKSSNIKWQDQAFKNLEKNSIGVQLGFSAQDKLALMNIPVYTSFSNTLELLRSISNDTIKAAVLQKDSTQKFLNETPEIAKNIIIMPEPFMVVDQYIVFNKYFYTKNRKLVKQVWQASKESREDPRYKDKHKKLIN